MQTPPPGSYDRAAILADLYRSLAADCEVSLATFIHDAWPHIDPEPFVYGRHIGLMCEYLEAFINGEIPRLLINIPPGHMKSIASSVALNAWTWGPRGLPGRRFMATSYRGDLALRDADKTRELIRSSWYQHQWGHVFNLRKGQDVKSRYTNNKGGYRFSSAISGIMGEGGDYVILDDPHNVEEAESDEVRDETVRKIRMALPTRVRSKKGGVLVIMQRLHERDYAGRMIADEAELVHLCLPARFEKDHPYITKPRQLDTEKGTVLPGDFRTREGELLWPELFDDKRLTALTVELSAYGEAGQLQQRPAPREGGMFQRGDFQIIDRKPEGRHETCRGWDLGATEGGGKFTAGVKISVYAGGMILVEDVSRGQWSPYKVDRNIKAAVEQDGYDVIQDFPQDPGQAGKAQIRHIAKLVEGYIARFSPETGAKEVRAGPLSSQAEAGNLFLLRADWNDAYIDELCGFPTGTYTDQADASSRAYARLIGKRETGIGAAPEAVQLEDPEG